MGEDKEKEEKYAGRRREACTHAPEWAEHARGYHEDEPCDDARAGTICGDREDEEPCPIV